MAIRKVIFISRLKAGSEQQLMHDLPSEFPQHALAQIDGIKQVTICQGNGLFAAIVEYEGDFRKIFDQYLASPSIQAFQFKIKKFLKKPPRSADPSDLSLVGDVFYWDGENFNRASG
jgi:hypothetical protein